MDEPKDALDEPYSNAIPLGKSINLVMFEVSDMGMVYRLIGSGWSNIFDAILYATGRRLDIHILSADRNLIFLKDLGMIMRFLLVMMLYSSSIYARPKQGNKLLLLQTLHICSNI